MSKTYLFHIIVSKTSKNKPSQEHLTKRAMQGFVL